MTPYLSTEDLAERWRTSRDGVLLQRHRGLLRPATRIGKRVLWLVDDIERWEAEQREQPRPAA